MSFSEFMVLAWMALALLSSPYFISCKETLPYKCDLGERRSYTANEMLADDVDAHDFHKLSFYVIPKAS